MSAPEQQTDEREGRSWVLIASAVFVVILVVVCAIVLATRSGHDEHTATPATVSATPTAMPGPTSGFGTPEVDSFGRRVDVPNNPYGQPLDQVAPQRKPTDPDWLTAAPAGTLERGGWQHVYGATVPFSTSDGPTRITNGVPGGYAHTPQGAALAAAYVMWETTARPADRALREQMVVMTAADFAEFDRLKAAGKAPERQPDSVTRWMIAPDAFRITSWAEDLCVLNLAVKNAKDKNGTAQWLSAQIAMVWDGSGWRMRLPVDRKLPQEPLTSIAGWTKWA